MSIQGMRRRFAVHLRYVLYLLIGVFIIGLPFVFTPGLSRRTEDEAQEATQDVIARVNGQPLRRASLDKWFDQSLMQMVPIYQSIGQSVNLNQISQFRLQAFDQALMTELLLGQARAEKIPVSRGEVKRQAERMADEELRQVKSRYKGEQLQQALGEIYTRTEGRPRQRMSEGAFRKWVIKRMVTQGGDDLRAQIAIEKLRQKVSGSVSPTEQELLASYDRVSLRELTVSLHPQGKPARTEEQARKRAEQLLAKARQGTDLAALVKAESDDQALKATGGLRSSLSLSALPPEESRAVQALKPGELAGPIKMPAGYLVIKLEGRRRDLPQDFEQKKQEHLRSFTDQRRSERWMEYSSKLRQQAKLEILDPEILGYQHMQQGDPVRAIDQLEKAAPEGARLRGLVGGTIHYMLGDAFAQRGKWKEAADSYGAAVDMLAQDERNPLPGVRGEALMALARVTENLGKRDEALGWYQEASNWSDTPRMHEQLVSIFQRMAEPELVKKEQDWLKTYQEAQAERAKAALEEQRAAAPESKPPTEQKPTPAPAAPGKP